MGNPQQKRAARSWIIMVTILVLILLADVKVINHFDVSPVHSSTSIVHISPLPLGKPNAMLGMFLLVAIYDDRQKTQKPQKRGEGFKQQWAGKPLDRTPARRRA